MIKSVRADKARLAVSKGYMGVNDNRNLGRGSLPNMRGRIMCNSVGSPYRRKNQLIEGR